MAREFLGNGWKFPIAVNARGGIATSSREQDVEEAIWIILATSKGSRVMEPTFGCGIHDYVFAPNNAATRASLAHEVHQALAVYEPRVEVMDVRAQSSPGRDNLLLIHVDYRMRSTHTQRNLVYPFYLQEQ